MKSLSSDWASGPLDDPMLWKMLCRHLNSLHHIWPLFEYIHNMSDLVRVVKDV